MSPDAQFIANMSPDAQFIADMVGVIVDGPIESFDSDFDVVIPTQENTNCSVVGGPIERFDVVSVNSVFRSDQW